LAFKREEPMVALRRCELSVYQLAYVQVIRSNALRLAVIESLL
jgi:hypothetical protein